MAVAINARRKGDTYQARFFWLKLLHLRTSDFIKSVQFESDQISFVDDVVVVYNDLMMDQITRRRYDYDFFQCKYHMTQNGFFSIQNLIDPEFINNKDSMLMRLFNAYKRLTEGGIKFRLNVVSSWSWHPDDPLAEHIHEGHIRDTFYDGRKRPKTAPYRKLIAEHIQVAESELKPFLDSINFDTGRNLTHLSGELETHLKFASLQPIDLRTSKNVYDDLAWKLFEQQCGTFDKDSLNTMLAEEKLIVSNSAGKSEISICSCPQFARRPADILSKSLDLTDLFDKRFVLHDTHWNNQIPLRLEDFLKEENLRDLAQPIHLFFDCHLSISFLMGMRINPKFNLPIIPVQKTQSSNYVLWPEPDKIETDIWEFKSTGTVEKEAILCISVSNPVDGHVDLFLQNSELSGLGRIHCCPKTGTGLKSISSAEHAWSLGYDLQRILRTELPPTCQILHVFLSVPAAFAYILGKTLRHITPIIQLYEHDFEGLKYPQRYFPSITVN